jgi:hypothetical protein
MQVSPVGCCFWQQRNAIVHQGNVNSEEGIVILIRQEVKNKVKYSGRFCNSVMN